MQKTNFEVHIHNKGEENAYLLEMIGYHNGNHIVLNLEMFIAHIEAIKAHKKTLAIGYTFDEENSKLDIWEGEEHNFTLSIEENEVYELAADKVFNVHELLNPILKEFELNNNLKSKNN